MNIAEEMARFYTKQLYLNLITDSPSFSQPRNTPLVFLPVYDCKYFETVNEELSTYFIDPKLIIRTVSANSFKTELVTVVNEWISKRYIKGDEGSMVVLADMNMVRRYQSFIQEKWSFKNRLANFEILIVWMHDNE